MIRSTFVHVGKAAGTSVQGFLHDIGVTYNTETERNCSEDKQVCQVHARPVTPADLAHDVPVFITMRDPISRSVSAFNWLNPRGGACAAFAETNCRRGGKMSSRLYECFEDIDSFARALDSETQCGDAARVSLHHGASHLSMGFAFYLANVVGSLTRERHAGSRLVRRYELVHTDNLAEDMRRVAAWAHLVTPETAASTPMRHRFGSYPGKNKTFLSSRGRRLLRQYLESDYEIVHRLEAYAAIAATI